ncbi:MAG: hypothetical protein MAG715_00800 [Methanonatronarchaeales archaeon]|nr:hypothetical protein [Methanonatronarchaeales archaeon]
MVGARWLTSLVRDIAKSLLIVAVVSGTLFAYTGVWPPLVVVESGSMEPNLYRGDIVLVKAVDGGGRDAVDTFREGGDEHFGMAGDVVVYNVPGDGRPTPIIHRAMYWTDVGGGTGGDEVATSPGYVTKGDANEINDQYLGIAPAPIRPEWIRGRAFFRVPLLGYVRLAFGELFHF